MSVVAELRRQRDELAVRREPPVLLPVRARLRTAAELLKRHRQIEVRLRVGRIYGEGLAVGSERLAVASQIVVDVA